jgi:hypothetical protein
MASCFGRALCWEVDGTKTLELTEKALDDIDDIRTKATYKGLYVDSCIDSTPIDVGFYLSSHS